MRNEFFTIQYIEDQNRNKVKLTATEDGPSTGLFRVSFTPVAATPAGKNQVQVAEGGTLTAIYHDKENTKPGVPTYRYATIDHAVFSTPKLRMSHATVKLLDPADFERPPGLRGLNIGFETQMQRLERELEEELTAAERAKRARAEAAPT